jgi:hypothetical protein
MNILAVKENDSGAWEDIVQAVKVLGFTEETCSGMLDSIRNYGNRRAFEGYQNGVQTFLVLALDDCRATLEGLLERLNKTSGKINEEDRANG